MSKPTTQEIIQLGNYLSPNFDPSTLTIAHLIGIFQHHNIAYPSQHNKGKLVEVFNANIKANAGQLKKETLSRQATEASVDGFLNGHTGMPVSPAAPSEPVSVCQLSQQVAAFRRVVFISLTFPSNQANVRRSSRRSSVKPEEPKRPEPVCRSLSSYCSRMSHLLLLRTQPKRRRSSAQPLLGRGPAKKSIVSPPALSEASEEEEEEQDVEPARKVGRSNRDVSLCASHMARHC